MHRALVLVTLLAAGCGSAPGTRARMLTPPGGQIAVVETPRGNRRVDIEVDHIAPPSAYAPGATGFVVWIVPREGAPIRAGEIDYDARARAGAASVLTPYDEFRVLVTAERADRAGVAPGEHVVVDREIAS